MCPWGYSISKFWLCSYYRLWLIWKNASFFALFMWESQISLSLSSNSKFEMWCLWNENKVPKIFCCNRYSYKVTWCEALYSPMIVTVGLLGTLPNQGLTKNRYKYNITWGHPLFSLGTKLSRPHQSILSKSRFIVMSTIKIHVVDWNLIFPF